MKKINVRKITDNALVAALYYIFTIVLGGLAFNNIQFRIAEILIFLVFFRKDFVIGITLGCLFANLHSPLAPWDPIFGTLATFISAMLVAYSRKLFMGIIYPTIINAVIVGFMLYFVLELPLLATIGLVALEEFVVLLLGFTIFSVLGKKPGFLNLILAEDRHEREF